MKVDLEGTDSYRSSAMTRLIVLCVFFGFNGIVSGASASEDSPEVSLGEKLFRDPRFSENFARESGGNVNALVQRKVSDPVLDSILDAEGRSWPSPFRGQSMSCVSCHMVDDAKGGLGSRAYADFSRKSAIPDRGDGLRETQRNSQALVQVAIPRAAPALFHFDGEFTDLRDLVLASLTGRNMGWLRHESARARSQVVRVLREDSGQDDLGRKFGGSYVDLFAAPELPAALRMNLETASDDEILGRVAEVMTIYLEDLTFSEDDDGLYNGSPYDQFLKANQLPQKPAPGESEIDYALRLFRLLRGLKSPRWVAPQAFQLHRIPARFEEPEFRGLVAFLNPRVGHCFGCHAPPHFSDFRLRNSGVSQVFYDSVHGQGAFARLRIPGFAEKQMLEPEGLAKFQQSPQREVPSAVDLGAWGVFGNPLLPKPQQVFRWMFCPLGTCNDEEILARSLATFKTPVLRDLGHSAPYFHTGHARTLREAVEFYNAVGVLQRSGLLKNGDPRLSPIQMSPEDIEAIELFLNALNEDYE